jgi:hypothetical protein
MASKTSKSKLSIKNYLSIFISLVITFSLLSSALTIRKNLEIKEAATAPTCTGVKAPSCVGLGQTYQVTVEGLSNASSLKFPTWDSVGGQDDIVWYTKSGNWFRNIFQGDHPNGNIITHVYMYNSSYSDVYCGGVEVPLCSPPSGNAPFGALDTANGYVIKGWAKDPDYNGPISVHVYIDGVLYESLLADMDSGDVGKHRFDWEIPPFGYGSHEVAVYAIGVDANGYPDGNNPALSGSPKTFNIGCDRLRNTYLERLYKSRN